jgi:hypothetical protein
MAHAPLGLPRIDLQSGSITVEAELGEAKLLIFVFGSAFWQPSRIHTTNGIWLTASIELLICCRIMHYLHARRPGLKVLFVTGYAENATIGNGPLDEGMEVMTKPFAVDALASRVQGMIGG